MTKKPYTLAEIASKLGYQSHGQVAKLLRRGAIPGGFRVGNAGQWRIDRVKFDEWYAQQAGLKGTGKEE